MDEENTYVVDANVLLTGLIDFSKGRFVTSNLIVDEIKSGELVKGRIELAIKQGLIRVTRPTASSIDKVKNIARETGDLHKLSQADIEIIAIALDIISQNPTIITDDYSVQNVSSRLGIPYRGLFREIRTQILWTYYCSICAKDYGSSPSVKYCNDCGNELNRKPKL